MLTIRFQNWLMVIGLSVLGGVTHLLPHIAGMTTVGAISMLCAAWLPRRFVMLPVLVTVAVADLFNDSYGILAMGFVYAAHLLAALAITPILRLVRSANILAAAVVNAVLFYLISNIAPIAMGHYPITTEGLLTCYINALPFLVRGVLANVIFGGAAFGCIYLAGRIKAYRLITEYRR